MDYHVINNAEYLDDFQKPIVLWTKGDMLAFIAYLDSYIDALKRDYQTIVDYQQTQNTQILSDSDKQIITSAVVDWAHDREQILSDSDNVAFPFTSHINSAELNEDKISKAVGVAITVLDSANIESETGVMKQQEAQEVKPLEYLKDIAKYGAIGLGIWVAYKIFMETRR